MAQSNAPRVLISRLSHIGDCVLTLPLLTGLRRMFPQAHLAWCVESPTHKLIQHHPDLDQIILVPKQWLKKPSAWRELSSQIRGQFDIAIDPQGITKSAMICKLSKAKHRFGIKGRWGREFSTILNNHLVKPVHPHLLDRTMEILAEISSTMDPHRPYDGQIHFGLPETDQGQQLVHEFFGEQSFSSRPVVINPGASWESKRWETSRFGDVAKHLYRQHQLRSVITWAGPEEFEIATTIKEIAGDSAVVAPRTTLGELASLLHHSRFFIGCDTGPMHIATAMGAPCIGLHGTTLPTESGAYGPQNFAIQKWYQSGSCRQRRTASNDAMRDIAVSDVNQSVDQMVQRTVERSSVELKFGNIAA